MIHLDTNYLIGLLVKGSPQALEVDGWLAAATLKYTDEDLDLVAAAIRTSGAGDGPTRP